MNSQSLYLFLLSLLSLSLLLSSLGWERLLDGAPGLQGDQDHQWVIKESLFPQFMFDMLLFETDTHIVVHI